MRDASIAVAASPRLAFLCHVVVGWLAVDRGSLVEANASARAAAPIPVAPEFRSAGLALEARIALAEHDNGRALALSVEAAQLEQASGDLDLTFGMGGCTLALVRAATDDLDGARTALTQTSSRLAKVASTIASDEDRARFWQRPLANATIHRIAEDVGLSLPVVS
jgi:hypothetical protein